MWKIDEITHSEKDTQVSLRSIGHTIVRGSLGVIFEVEDEEDRPSWKPGQRFRVMLQPVGEDDIDRGRPVEL